MLAINGGIGLCDHATKLCNARTVIQCTFIEFPAWLSITRLVRFGLGALNEHNCGNVFGAMPHNPGTTGKDCIASASDPASHLGGVTQSVNNMCAFAVIVGNARPLEEAAPKPEAGF